MNVSTVTFKQGFYVINQKLPSSKSKLALGPKIFCTEKGDQRIEWQDSGRDVAYNCKQIIYDSGDQKTIDKEHPPREIKVILQDETILILRILTLNDERIPDAVKNKKFKTDEEMQKYYEDYDPVNESYRRMFG